MLCGAENYTHVRVLMGFGRIDWKKAVLLMNNIYTNHWRNLQYLYNPQQKLVEKVRIGSKIIRKLDQPKTPLTRLAPHLSHEKYFDLHRQKESYDPRESMRILRQATKNLMSYFKDTIPRAQWGKIIL